MIKSFCFLFVTSTFVLQAQTINSGVATYFDGIGTPYGGCGVPEQNVETPNYVALNVFNTPGSGTQYVRPITGSNLALMGEFQNGNNCGRWLKVTILENCIGTNDGALGQPLCRGTNAMWVTDRFYGAQLDMIVTDACGDGNGWCRDQPYHLDLHTPSLSNFELNGQTTTGMYPTYFNNRKIQWEFIEAPNYTGDIKIYMMQAAQQYYLPIMINHLQNGIHKVEQKVGSTWVNVPRNSDLGQSFILPNNTSPYTIRVTDANDKLVNNGREYTFSFPNSCGNSCTAPATEVSYTTYDPVVLSIANDQERSNNVFLMISSNGDQVKLFFSSTTTHPFEIKVVNLLGQEMYSQTIPANVDAYEIGVYKSGLYKLMLYSSQTSVHNASFYVPQ